MTFSKKSPCFLQAFGELFPKQVWSFKVQARTKMLLKPRGKSVRNGANTLFHLVLVPCVDAVVFSILTIAFNTDEHLKKHPRSPKLPDLSLQYFFFSVIINFWINFILTSLQSLAMLSMV